MQAGKQIVLTPLFLHAPSPSSLDLREMAPDTFIPLPYKSILMPEPNSYDPHSSYSGVAVGNQKLVQADQLSGRVVAVSNAAFFKDPLFNDTQRALICYMR